MERYLKLTKVTVRHHLLPYILVSILYVLFAPVLMGMRNLDASQVAKIVEIYLSLLGVILLIPVFSPDMNPDIRELVRSKKQSMLSQHLLRLMVGYGVLLLLGVFFLLCLKQGKCMFDMSRMFYSFLANATFLGGMGMFLFGLVDQIVFAYMLPLVYYVVNFGMGTKQLGNFYLFSMQAGSLAEKNYLLTAGILFLVAGLLIREIKNLRRR